MGDILKYIVVAALLIAALIVGYQFFVGDSPTEEELARQSQQAAQQREQPAEEAPEAVRYAGSIRLTLQGPVETTVCYATLLVLPTQTGNVLQLASYDTPAAETYPSVFLRANVGGIASIDQLAGSPIQADLFIKTAADEPVWSTLHSAPVELNITQHTASTFQAQVSGQLERRSGQEQSPVSGTFTAVIQ